MRHLSHQRKDLATAGQTRGIPNQWLFCYGTLMVETVFSHISGIAKPVTKKATLCNYERRALSAKAYPGVRQLQGASVEGVIYRLPKLALPALDRYEGDMYFREAVKVTTPEGEVEAWCYVLRPRYCHLMLKNDWSLQNFCNKHLQAYLERIREKRLAPR
jgi:gamma-glutamylcyclotransferase (GGCT)/AIG2-like uncharacterized protein YtfP